MNFWKTSFWSTIATLARLVSQFVVAKLLAVFVGPAVFGIFGQFQSFVSLVQLGSGGVISSGVTRYSAFYHDKSSNLSKLVVTATLFALCASVLSGFLIIIFSKPLSVAIFQGNEYRWLLIVFGATLFGYTLNQLFLSILNGLNHMVQYALVGISGAIISVTVIGALTFFYHQNGALLGLVLTQLILFFVSLFFIRRLKFLISIRSFKIDVALLKKLLKFALMSVTSAIVLPLSQMILRRYVAHNGSWADVGYWEGVSKISNAYLLLITTIISTYALPKYSQIQDNAVLAKEVFAVLYKLAPTVIFFASLIYLFRHQVVLILFSHKFLSMQPLFLFQLIGDVFKVASWVVATTLISREKIKTFIGFEVIFTLLFVLFSIIFFNKYGLIGLTEAFALSYFLYFFLILVWFLRYVKCA